MIVINSMDDNFGATLNCAVRYAIGRRTYMPGLVVGFIKPLVPELSTKTLWAIKRDINDSEKYDALGDPEIDAPLWRELFMAVQKELIKRGKT